MATSFAFNPPPGWPSPPAGWVPPEGWQPDPHWPPAPAGWSFWIATEPVAPQVPPPLVAESPPQPVEPIRPKLSCAGDNGIARGEDETAALQGRIEELERALALARSQPYVPEDLVDLNDERVLQEVGIYNYHHPLETSEEYRDRLQSLQDRIKSSVLQRNAILASEMFTFNNSLAKGRRMTSDFSKLMLRAYNAEADTCVRALRAGNIVTAKKRLEASVTSIAKLGSMMEMRVNPDFHALRIEELELTADFAMKQQEERERAREERDRLREERKAEQELAAERERLDKQRAHYANALHALQATGDTAEIAELAMKIEALDEAIAQNDFRASNIGAGYVYVISNPGAFGPSMVKIGMTRRLEPMDRIRELGDASVPFPFEVHALFFSEDAVALENDLHKSFSGMRVNRVNERREFFFATPRDVHATLSAKVGNLLQFDEFPEATQYLQSRKYWPV